jgi:hypothetical protein
MALAACFATLQPPALATADYRHSSYGISHSELSLLLVWLTFSIESLYWHIAGHDKEVSRYVSVISLYDEPPITIAIHTSRHTAVPSLTVMQHISSKLTTGRALIRIELLHFSRPAISSEFSLLCS